jgi:hypothetical protein
LGFGLVQLNTSNNWETIVGMNRQKNRYWPMGWFHSLDEQTHFADEVCVIFAIEVSG